MLKSRLGDEFSSSQFSLNENGLLFISHLSELVFRHLPFVSFLQRYSHASFILVREMELAVKLLALLVFVMLCRQRNCSQDH
jgi:branched-subunit amino acid transport protein AzlD